MEEVSLDDFVRQLEQLADGLGLERFALAGFSMGGLVVQGLALARSTRIAPSWRCALGVHRLELAHLAEIQL